MQSILEKTQDMGLGRGQGLAKDPEYFCKKCELEAVAEWRQLLARLGQTDEEEPEQFSTQTLRWAARAAGRAQVKARGRGGGSGSPPPGGSLQDLCTGTWKEMGQRNWRPWN